MLGCVNFIRGRRMLVLGIAVAALVIAWLVVDFAYVCTRWTTRIHFKNYGDRPMRVCEEWHLRWK
jgi:hypothetical protein